MLLLKVLVHLVVSVVTVGALKGWSAAQASSGIWFNVSKEYNNECNRTEIVDDVEIVWDVKHGKLYGARPHCLDSNNVFVLRTCPANTQEVSEKCTGVQMEISDCPEDFQSISDHCVKILEKRTYEASQCPYGYSITFPMSVVKLGPERVWVPLVRDREYGIGAFMVDGVKIGKDLDSLIRENVVDGDESSMKLENCMVYNYEKHVLEEVSCSLEFPRICAYEKLHASDYRYCDGMAENCVNQEFDHGVHKCFCLRNHNYTCTPAEMWLPYQSKIQFVEAGLIALHLYQKKLTWQSSFTECEYTNWAYSGLQVLKDDSSILHTNNGWIVDFSKSNSQFKICDLRYQVERVSLGELVESDGALRVDVKGREGLVMGQILCYTDGFNDSLIARYRKVDATEFGLWITPEVSGNYWCEGYGLEDFKKITTGKVFVSLDNIYMIEIDLKHPAEVDPTLKATAYGFMAMLRDHFVAETQIPAEFKWMKTLVLDRRNATVRYLVHICVDASFEHSKYFVKLREALYSVTNWPTSVLKLSQLYNSQFCGEDITYSNGTEIAWPETSANQNSTSIQQVCLKENGFPVLRMCHKIHLEGVRWGDVEDCYSITDDKSEVTDQLVQLLDSEHGNEVVLEDLQVLTSRPEELKAIDAYLISSIFQKLRSHPADLGKLAHTMSNVISMRKEMLNSAQTLMNATDRILYGFDLLLQENQARYSGIQIETENLFLLPFCPTKKNISGLALLDLSGSHTTLEIERGTSLQEVSRTPGLVAAVILPNDLLNAIGGSEISISVFLKDCLFAAAENSGRIISKNIAVILSETNSTIQLQILFKPTEKLSRKVRNCAFWDYGKQKGNWKRESVPTQFYPNLLLCTHDHATHFGLLISDKQWYYNPALDAITLTGFAASVLGILGIFTTALVLPNWRQHDGNKVIIHYGAVSIAQIVLFYISYEYQETYASKYCISVGALLHYTIICQFMWMLNMAYLMYMRYVQVLHSVQTWSFRTACLASYILSGIPVIVLVIFFQSYYFEGNVGICYPAGNGLKYAILAPIGVIMGVNVIIFLLIFYELLIKKRMLKDDTFGLRLKLVVLVFFMTGMTWGFGFLALAIDSISLEFAFCMTTSLQGFILFLFFIVLNKNTRVMYGYLWRKYKCCVFKG